VGWLIKRKKKRNKREEKRKEEGEPRMERER
jgi:hypothetical protein